MTDLKKVCRLVEENEIMPAINQLEDYINKVRTDIIKGEIPETTGQNLIKEATHLLNMIKA